MRSLLTLGLALMVTVAAAEVKLKVTINGREAGTATTSQRLMTDGGRLVELRITLVNGNKTVEIHTTSVFDAKGEPVRKAMDTSTSEHDSKFVIATFDRDGANLVINDGKTRKTQKIVVEKAAPRAETGGFWWLRDHPTIGSRVRQYAFNMDSLGWELTETTYAGDSSLVVNGHKTTAHVVKSATGDRLTTSWFDDTGEPLRIESGQIVMERIS